MRGGTVVERVQGPSQRKSRARIPTPGRVARDGDGVVTGPVGDDGQNNGQHPALNELQTRLQSEIQAVPVDALESHHARGALFVVRADLPLVKAALGLALDAVDDVRGWLESGALGKVVDADLDVWRGEGDLRFLIVQPYVLVAAPSTSAT